MKHRNLCIASAALAVPCLTRTAQCAPIVPHVGHDSVNIRSHNCIPAHDVAVWLDRAFVSGAATSSAGPTVWAVNITDPDDLTCDSSAGTGYKACDLKVNSLGQNRIGAGIGSCTVDHNLIDEQLTVFYSTDGGSNWTEAEWIKRSTVLNYQTYGTRNIDLSGLNGNNNNSSFALRFRWQLNTASDAADLDNIKVIGMPL